MATQPPEADTEWLLDAVGAAFGRLRQRTRQLSVDPPFTAKDLSRNLVLNIVDETAGEVTVGDVADQLAVDPSAGSRLVSDCIQVGLLRRSVSQVDGRRAVLSLTKEGVELRARFARQHRQAFELITRDWSSDERLTFARLLVKYVDAATRIDSPAVSGAVPADDSDSGAVPADDGD
jgi:DNA-binding MarR family transcriptional regulator